LIYEISFRVFKKPLQKLYNITHNPLFSIYIYELGYHLSDVEKNTESVTAFIEVYFQNYESELELKSKELKKFLKSLKLLL